MPTEIDIAALWNFGDPAASERRFREALDGARAEGRTELKAELLTQIARAQGLAGRFDDAHRTLGEAAVALGVSDCRGRVRLHLESGRLLNTSRVGDHGRAHFEAALSAAERLGEDDLAVDAAHMLAIVAESGGSAMAWNQRALRLAETSANPAAQRWRASLLNNIGWAHHDAGRFSEALAFFERALAERERAPERAAEIRIARWAVARALRSLGRIDEALASQRALREEWAAVGGTDTYVEEEIGECLLVIGDGDAARAHFSRAIATVTDGAAHAGGDPVRLARLRALAGR